MGLYWVSIGVIWGLYWGYMGFILGFYWGHIRVILGRVLILAFGILSHLGPNMKGYEVPSTFI